MEHWDALEWDFHHLLGIDLEVAYRARSWRWFEVRVRGLLSMTPVFAADGSLSVPPSSLASFFHDNDPEPEATDV